MTGGPECQIPRYDGEALSCRRGPPAVPVPGNGAPHEGTQHEGTEEKSA